MTAVIDLTTHKLTRLYGAFCEDALCLNSKAMLAIAPAKPDYHEVTGIGLKVYCEGMHTDTARPMVRVKTAKGMYLADKKTGIIFDDTGRCMSSDNLRLVIE